MQELAHPMADQLQGEARPGVRHSNRRNLDRRTDKARAHTGQPVRSGGPSRHYHRAQAAHRRGTYRTYLDMMNAVPVAAVTHRCSTQEHHQEQKGEEEQNQNRSHQHYHRQKNDSDYYIDDDD